MFDLYNPKFFTWLLEFTISLLLIFLLVHGFYQLKKFKNSNFMNAFLDYANLLRRFHRKNHQLHLVLLYCIIMIYVVIEFDSLQDQQYDKWDSFYVQPYIESCDIFQIPQERAVLKFYQFCLSDYLFDNPKVIPFLESIGILIVSFLLANKILHSNYAGLFAASLIITSNIFLKNTTTYGYSTEWAFFFILAVYLIYKRPEIVGVVYIMSVFAKGLTLLYIPVIFYLIYKSDISARNKKISYLSLVAVMVFTVAYTCLVGNNMVQSNVPITFDLEEIHGLVYSPIYNFTEEEHDQLILNLFLPLVLLGLYRARSWVVFVIIIYMFSMQIWLPLFSDYNMGSYRMVPMVLFLGVGFAISLYHHVITPLQNRLNNRQNRKIP